MIRFKRDGTDVIIKVDSNLDVKKPVYIFTYFCEDENEAELLINHLQNEYDLNQEHVWLEGSEYESRKRVS